MRRQLGAHVTADAEEQWIRGDLPLGASFDAAMLGDIEKLAPDCGYELRQIQVEAAGRIEVTDERPVFSVSGGGMSFPLVSLGAPPSPDQTVLLVGHMHPPFGVNSPLTVVSITDRADVSDPGLLGQ